MKKMNQILGIMLISMVLMGMGASSFAQDRVVCTVEVLSDQSATVQLKWQSGQTSERIRITGWTLIDATTLKITYITGTAVEAGWDVRKIEGATYHFPMKIMLQLEGVDKVPFTDLPTAIEGQQSILNLYDRNVISGYADGTFKPNALVSRAEFAKLVTATAVYPLTTQMISPFKDVAVTYWGMPYIGTLAEKGIFMGRSDGTFDPKGTITMGEILAVIHRTFSLYAPQEAPTYPYALAKHWSNGDFAALYEVGIVKTSDGFFNPYTPNAKATRVQCAVLLSRVLEKLHQTK